MKKDSISVLPRFSASNPREKRIRSASIRVYPRPIAAQKVFDQRPSAFIRVQSPRKKYSISVLPRFSASNPREKRIRSASFRVFPRPIIILPQSAGDQDPVRPVETRLAGGQHVVCGIAAVRDPLGGEHCRAIQRAAALDLAHAATIGRGRGGGD